METSLSDRTGQVLHDSVDFAQHHEAALITAGVVVLGTVAFVKEGGVGKLLDLVGPAEDAAAKLLPKAAPELSGMARIGEDGGFLKGIDNYVFDLDRTLVPTGEAYKAQFSELTKQLVKHTGLDEDFVSDAIQQTSKRIGSPLFADRLDLVKPIQDLYPGVNLNERFPDIAPTVRTAYHAALQPSQDVVDLLDSLTAQGKPLHVFTASPPATAAEKLDASGLSKYFQTVFTGASHPIEDGPGRELLSEASTRSKIVELTKLPKANQSGYRQILSYLHVDPESTLMTGDSNALDIAPAKQIGMRTAQANWIHHDVTGYAIPDLTLETPGQLQKLVEQNAW